MKKNSILIVSIICLIIVIVSAYLMYTSLTSEYALERLAKIEAIAAPDFTVANKGGNDVKLSDFLGKPAVINFWASWCPPCKAEMPDFEEMYKKYGAKVNFLMINTTDGNRETLEKAKAHIEANGFTFPVYYDIYMSASYTYQASSIPATYFIDKEGRLITYAQGRIDCNILEKGIKMIL